MSEGFDLTLAVLEDVAEFLEGQSDVVDGSYGEPHPNRAMSLLRDVEERIETLKKAGKADRFARDLCQALNEGDGSYKP